MNSTESERSIERNAVALYDVGNCVKSWGRRGFLAGGIFGFALGVTFVAISFNSDVLTFGVVGTLIVAAVEGAVIAGAFGACTAALYGQGVIRDRAAGLDRMPPFGRQAPEVDQKAVAPD
jgi:hypothetical protein